MPQRTIRRRVLTIPYQANSLVREEIPISGKVRRLFLKLVGTLDITVEATAALAQNPGTLIPSLSIILDREIVLKQGRWNDWRDRMYAHYKLPAETADAITVDETTILSTIIIPFITPLAGKPVDTVLDMDAFQRLDIEVQWGDENSIVAGGTKAWTTDPEIQIVAEISSFDPPPEGLYKELAFDSDGLGTAANTNLQLELVTGPRLDYHHVFLSAEDVVANSGRTKVATAINSLTLQQQGAGESSNPFGLVSGYEMQYIFDQLFATVDGIQTGLYYIPFQGQFDGRNTFNLATAGLDDLRLIIDHAAFTTAGIIRTMYGTIERFVPPA